MKTWAAWAGVAALLAAAIAALLAPWSLAAGLLLGGVVAMRRGQRTFVVAASVSAAVYALLLAWLDPGPTTAQWGGITLGLEGAQTGAIGVVRLSSMLAVNLAAVQTASLAHWVDALRLPRTATAYLAAVVLTAQDLGHDYRRLVEARSWNGDWPTGRLQRLGAAAGLMPHLLLTAYRHGDARRDALRMAGIATGPQFAPIIAVTALAAAGRLALVAVPNVSLVYVIVFAGGVVSGPRVGAAAGALSMLLTDLLLTGLAPLPFVNVPAMAAVGAMGGAFQGMRMQDPGSVSLWAALTGILATFLFSILADTLEWILVPEFRGNVDLLRIRLAAGLAFNALPALANGILFGTVVGPVARAFKAYRA